MAGQYLSFESCTLIWTLLSQLKFLIRFWELDSDLQRKCGLETDEDTGDIKEEEAGDDDHDNSDDFFKLDSAEDITIRPKVRHS